MTNVMEILDAGKGDMKVMWDPDKEDEVTSAQKQFTELVGKGYAAFRVTRKGDKGEQIRSFDRHAEALILAPQIRGG